MRTDVLRLELRNDTDATFSGVKVTLRVANDVSVCGWKPEMQKPGHLPKPPIVFGEARRDSDYLGIRPAIRLDPLDFRGLWVPDTSWDVGAGETIVNFADETVRAHGSESLPPIFLAAREHTPTEICASWEATAISARGRLRGTVDIQLSTEVVDAETLLREPPDGD